MSCRTSIDWTQNRLESRVVIIKFKSNVNFGIAARFSSRTKLVGIAKEASER
jgi:hypothetical protein